MKIKSSKAVSGLSYGASCQLLTCMRTIMPLRCTANWPITATSDWKRRSNDAKPSVEKKLYTSDDIIC